VHRRISWIVESRVRNRGPASVVAFVVANAESTALVPLIPQPSLVRTLSAAPFASAKHELAKL